MIGFHGVNLTANDNGLHIIHGHCFKYLAFFTSALINSHGGTLLT